MAALHAGIPIGTPIATVNRQCSSGLTAVNQIAGQIATGQIDIGIGKSTHTVQRFRLVSYSVRMMWCIGAGVESMTFGYGPSAQPASYSSEVLSNPAAEDCLIPMGITSENVAKEYGISREAQDKFAARSFQKAAEAQKVLGFSVATRRLTLISNNMCFTRPVNSKMRSSPSP